MLVLASVPAGVAAAQESPGTRTLIASPPGGPPAAVANGPSDNTAFSQDDAAALMAFDSAASNLVQRDGNTVRDVFVLARQPGEGNLLGSLSRASVGRRQANGASRRPSIDGGGKRAPHCVTFESTATNLARGDRSRDLDVYVRDLTRRLTALVSVRHRSASHAVIDGKCKLVAYQAGGFVFVRDLSDRTTLRLGRGSRPDQQTNGKGVAYERRGQIYYQALRKKGSRGRKARLALHGRARIVTAGIRGAGNGRSSNPSLDYHGRYVAFESRATNLCLRLCKGVSRDRNGAISDVFRRTLSARARSKDRMQMVSFSAPVNAQGNGASHRPEITGTGVNVVFDSQATNLRPTPRVTSVDPNGPVRDVFYWDFAPARGLGSVSRESRPDAGGAFAGPSWNASASKRPNYIGFTSSQAGAGGEGNGPAIADAFVRYLSGRAAAAGSVDEAWRNAIRGIWLSPQEVAALRTSGDAWRRVKATADGGLGRPMVSDQNSLHDTSTLAVALVALRTGDPSYRIKAADAIMGAIGTENASLRAGSRILPIARNTTSYVVAADLIGLRALDPAKDASFRAWLERLRTQTYDGETLTRDHETRANNHGTMAGASRAAIAAYLGDTATLARVAQVFKGWLGDRSAHAGFGFPPRSGTFMPDPSQPRPVNPVGASKDGHDLDGVLPAEWVRCGAFKWPPCYTDYAWGGLAGASVQAEILRRAGHDAWTWESRALLRAYQRLAEMAARVDPIWWKDASTGDDSWQPWLVNFAYGAGFPATRPSNPGKNMGWTDWTHADRRAG